MYLSTERGVVTSMSNPYAPIFILLALGFGFAALSVGTSLVVGPKRYNRAKLEAYECGIQPTPQAQGGGRPLDRRQGGIALAGMRKGDPNFPHPDAGQ